MGTLIPFEREHAVSAIPAQFSRPLDAEGVLLAAEPAPRTAVAIRARVEQELTEQLAAVCRWPAHERDRNWRPGDYSFLVLEFSVPGDVTLFVQFWSEPEEAAVIFEVVSGAADARVERHLGRRRQEALQDRGFTRDGGAQNFRKRVVVDGEASLHAMAREAVSVLCRVLGYDGRVPLHYRLHLGTRMSSELVYTDLNAADLAKLMRTWGVQIERPEDDGGVVVPDVLRCHIDDYRFTAFLRPGPCETPGQYGLLFFRWYAKGARLPVAALANEINSRLMGAQASVDSDGDLQIDQTVVLAGGVSATNLHTQFLLWHANLDSIVKMISGESALAH